ncbi:hypothetical protein CROQUDRAFT_57375 [Cronartium quercuum f. sp. fusiforme G11]|uniref:Transcription factor CBF/NF-Y/archaeal histone domain-containing protein n=1 Tax=Cronartium quercuum f. sp. fusiforme G11 TaxID=708437 RepID=A0A9P6NVQ8_9BASI|nr:hypothetical protein CROQUDRAFT_57375 [Cronartium quercuum f. sp. fusiforme G11]
MKKKGSSSRFPVARIKKIMQADEDVGKVAQATPLLVSKAVEMFMQSLVKAAVFQAQNRGSKKVQAYHLKQAVMVTESFDFLKDILMRVPDPTTTANEDEPPKPTKPKPTTSQEENDDEDVDDEDEEQDVGAPSMAEVEEDDDEEYY